MPLPRRNRWTAERPGEAPQGIGIREYLLLPDNFPSDCEKDDLGRDRLDIFRVPLATVLVLITSLRNRACPNGVMRGLWRSSCHSSAVVSVI